MIVVWSAASDKECGRPPCVSSPGRRDHGLLRGDGRARPRLGRRARGAPAPLVDARAHDQVGRRRGDVGIYLSIRKLYAVNFSVFPVNARCGDVNSHRGAPSRGLEWARFEAASATDPAGRRTVHFPTTLPFFKTDITYDTNLRHIRYLEVARILYIWSWLLLNLQLKEMV